jgi:hypothetical protein
VLLYLLFDFLGHLGSSSAQLLLYWRTIFSQWQLVYNDIGIQPWHILIRPGEDINILFQQCYHSALDIHLQSGPNFYFLSDLLGTPINNLNLLLVRLNHFLLLFQQPG